MIREGGLKTLNTNSSAPRLNEYEIPTARATNLCIGGPAALSNLWKTMRPKKEEKSKMAASKLQVHVSASRQDFNAILTATSMLFRSNFPRGIGRIPHTQTGSTKDGNF